MTNIPISEDPGNYLGIHISMDDRGVNNFKVTLEK